MRGTDYEFVSADGSALLNRLIAKYESLTGRTLQPADPDRLFCSWVADIFIAERVNLNYVGNQNIPSRAVGVNLDALGEWIYNVPRNPAQPAKCTVRFTLTEAQSSAVLIPAGTRVTDLSQNVFWETTEDALVPIGSTHIDVMAQCMTDGAAGNGYTAGQINTLVDVNNIPFYYSCANTTISEGGADQESDDAYYARMRLVLDAYSTAGSAGAYVYHAKSVSNQIADVKAINPKRKRTAVLGVATAAGGAKCASIGGDQLDTASLVVKAHGASAAAQLTDDYTVDYEDGLLTITLVGAGALASETQIDVEINEDFGGHVDIYALMDDGNAAGSTIKNAIATACNKDFVRPLTDIVSVKDPSPVSYNINVTYYISNENTTPVDSIEAAVTKAVNEYAAWQCGRLGRDINPSKLWQMLMQTGIKRAVIASPTFRAMSDGADGSTPELAVLGTKTVTNGGYEDE